MGLYFDSTIVEHENYLKQDRYDLHQESNGQQSSPGENVLNDGRPIVFLCNHHATNDLLIIWAAVRTEFKGLSGKIFVKPQVFDSKLL